MLHHFCTARSLLVVLGFALAVSTASMALAQQSGERPADDGPVGQAPDNGAGNAPGGGGTGGGGTGGGGGGTGGGGGGTGGGGTGGGGGGTGGGNGGGTTTPSVGTGIFISNRAVGGVMIDADGFLHRTAANSTPELNRRREALLHGDPQQKRLRYVSLRRLESALDTHLQQRQPLPEEMALLAGLQEIRYVLVYPETGDIVLAGFGEPWRVDAVGNFVGETTGRPVLLLDDLLVALRATQQPAAISCSIDPTEQGLAQLQQLLAAQQSQISANPGAALASIEQALGPQNITFTGVAPDTHLALVLVAADYRMKSLAMHLEASPVRGLTSFLQMNRATSGNMMPRWWLAPEYAPLAKSPDGLAWELPPCTVKAHSEEAFLNASGQKQTSAKTNPAAERWAALFTENYAEIAQRLPIFAELQNAMQFALVGALVRSESLFDRSGYSFHLLLDESRLPTASLPTPRRVDSQASLLKKNGNSVISVSGGVQINPWHALDRVDTKQNLAAGRDKLSKHLATTAGDWWWK